MYRILWTILLCHLNHWKLLGENQPRVDRALVGGFISVLWTMKMETFLTAWRAMNILFIVCARKVILHISEMLCLFPPKTVSV